MIDVKLFEKATAEVVPHKVGEAEHRALLQLKELEERRPYFGDSVIVLVKLLAREIDNLRAEIAAK